MNRPVRYTATIDPMATIRRLLFLYDKVMAIITPLTAVMTFPVEWKISGKVSALRTAYGTYRKKDLIKGDLISFLNSVTGNTLII